MGFARNGEPDPLVHKARPPRRLHSLSENYNSFTEGFDTADLINAKPLLDGLQRI
jgi:hypothetical protein